MASYIYGTIACMRASWDVDIANRSKREKHISNKKERLRKKVL